MRRALLAAMSGLAIFASTAESAAQDAAAKKKALSLFNEGRKLIAIPDKRDAACDKFEESYALVARGDTLINLAECHRLQGKTATAWKEFGRVIDAAQQAKFDLATKVARERRADLEVILSFLTITVPPEVAALPGLTITLNGYPAPKDAWGKRVPVDPGAFELAASAEGRLPFVERFTIGLRADKHDVTIKLEPIPKPPPPPEVKPPPPPPRPARLIPPPPNPPPPRVPVWAWAFGGGGVVSLGAGAVFGVLSLTTEADLVKKCGGDPSRCPASTGKVTTPLANARDLDRSLLIVFSMVGLAGISVGATGIGLTAEKAKATRPKASFTVTPFGAGIGVLGSL